MACADSVEASRGILHYNIVTQVVVALGVMFGKAYQSLVVRNSVAVL